MFGSVTAGTIADELKHQFEITLDKRKIHLDHPLRTLGEHEVELRLHPEVTTTLKVRLDSSTPLPKPAEPAAAEKTIEGRPPRGAFRRERPPGRPRAEKREKAG
jgi:large subunit ribosomal protein L9